MQMRVVRNNSRNAALPVTVRQPCDLPCIKRPAPNDESPGETGFGRGAGASVRAGFGRLQFQRQLQMTSKALSSPVCARTVKRRATR